MPSSVRARLQAIWKAALWARYICFGRRRGLQEVSSQHIFCGWYGMRFVFVVPVDDECCVYAYDRYPLCGVEGTLRLAATQSDAAVALATVRGRLG